MNLPCNSYEFWNAPHDYDYVHYKNYKLTVRDKISSTRNFISYLIECIEDSEIPEVSKRIYFYPTLKSAKRSLRLFEQQGSLLSA